MLFRSVEPRGKAGTFVTTQPPHTRRYALVIPNQPHEPGFPRFWTALMHEAARLEQKLPGSRIVICAGNSAAHGNHSFTSLNQDALRHRLAGILFASAPFMFADTPLLDEPGIPRVAITSSPSLSPGLTSVVLDHQSFVTQAIEHLRARGRRKIALILTPVHSQNLHETYRKTMAKLSLSYRSHLAQESHPRSALGARHVAQLFMRLPTADRPDTPFATLSPVAVLVTSSFVPSGRLG